MKHAASSSFGQQVAAVPLQISKARKLRILMVTSRGTGRWVMPKGWVMDGRKPWKAAEIEALEEAGAEGYIGSVMLGTYHYEKWISDTESLPCRVRLYPMIVRHLKKSWKERGDRTRRWFSPKGAAKDVHEPELKELLLGLGKHPHKNPALRELLDK